MKISALEILFSLQKHLSTSLTNSTSSDASSSKVQPQFHSSHFQSVVSAILLCPPSSRPGASSISPGKLAENVRELFVEKWLSVYDDVRWWFLRLSTTVLTRTSPKDCLHILHNMLSIMEKLVTFPTEPFELNSWWVGELGQRPPAPKSSRSDADTEEEHDLADNEEDTDDWRKYFDEDDDAKSTKSKAIKGRVHELNLHQALHSLQAHRAVFTRTWLSFLSRFPLASSEANRNLSVRVLNIMHRGVLPHLTRPVLVMDWISACVDFGGTVGLLAFNALFTLMRDYNLDYPSFYTRLYAFLDQDVLHLKHRARFFRLTELFLSSTHLPATLLASFVKRLARLSLTAPPAAIVMVIPFTYNVLKRHPALMVMIHRVNLDDDQDSDLFLPEEINPNNANAIDSSLWELYSQRQHYDPAVSGLARIFEEAFTKPGYNIEDFLDHTYGTLIETETKRRIRKEPALAIDLKPSTEGDVISELWAL